MTEFEHVKETFPILSRGGWEIDADVRFTAGIDEEGNFYHSVYDVELEYNKPTAKAYAYIDTPENLSHSIQTEIEEAIQDYVFMETEKNERGY